MTRLTTAHTRGQLALALQEAFTAAVRLRSNRPVAVDAVSFRAQIKQLLNAADQEARRAGYASETVKFAVYAYIVFLDEAVLNSPQPMFADWPRRPLQEEVFGDHMGGETFFKNLDQLLRRQDSDELADLLEVYQLCLLLGFKGRFAVADKGELHGLSTAAAEKIQRIRGPDRLSPSWALPARESLPVVKDPWLPRLIRLAAASAALAFLLFVLFKLFVLRGGIRALKALALEIVP